MITVTATNAAGTVTGTHVITMYTPVQAGFTAWPTSGVAPLTVAFTNTSTGDFAASLWDLGDGITTTLPSPTHTYGVGGVYTVTLSVSGPGGTDAESKAALITVTDRYRVYLPLVLRQY